MWRDYEPPPFMIESPDYKLPRVRSIALKLYMRAKVFLQRAGTTIFSMMILIWFLASFPQAPNVENGHFQVCAIFARTASLIADIHSAVHPAVPVPIAFAHCPAGRLLHVDTFWRGHIVHRRRRGRSCCQGAAQQHSTEKTAGYADSDLAVFGFRVFSQKQRTHNE
jgi:hypothetical protein